MARTIKCDTQNVSGHYKVLFCCYNKAIIQIEKTYIFFFFFFNGTLKKRARYKRIAADNPREMYPGELAQPRYTIK